MEWTTTTTLDPQYFDNDKKNSEIQQVVFLDDKIIMELSDAYIGVDEVKFSLHKNFKIDALHKQYFGAFLKEKSIKNTLNGSNSFREEYRNFYFEQFPEEAKNRKAVSSNGILSGLFNSKSMSLEDGIFFNNLESISKYMNGENIVNIEEKIDSVLNHRKGYLGALPSQDRLDDNFVDSVKLQVIVKRYDGLIKDFASHLESNEGTNYMTQFIGSFVENSLDLFNDFKTEPVKTLPLIMVYKAMLFDIAYDQYAKIFYNKNIEDHKEVVFALNNVYEKIFGEKREFVKIEFDNRGYSYHLLDKNSGKKDEQKYAV